MICRIRIVLIILCFSSCKDDKTITTVNTQNQSLKSFETNYLIEVDELLKIANDTHIKILDFRKANIYKEEHIEGALNIWRSDIEDSSYSYKGMMAGKDQIETLFSNLGISTGDTIIIYDDNALCDSSRLWWLLQNYDFSNVKMFHGGISAWKSKNGPISKDVPMVQKAVFKLTEKPSLKYYITKEEMLQAVSNKTHILDTRTKDEYTGKRQKQGAAKGGRIPNSKFIDWAVAVNYDGDKRMKGIEELHKIYNDLGVTKSDTIIAYCHSGVRSAHTTFVLTQLLGYKNVKNYDGSWTEWSQFNDYPTEKDSITTILK